MATSLISLSLNTLVFDVATISFDERNALPDHPLETGVTVTDHCQPLPASMTITGTMSESPWSTATNGILSQRRAYALNYLQEHRKEALIVINETYGTFTNYMIEGWHHALDNIARATIVLQLKQVVFASAGFVKIPVSAPASPAVSSSFADSSNAGEQGTTAPTPTAAAADSSVLYSLLYGG